MVPQRTAQASYHFSFKRIITSDVWLVGTDTLGRPLGYGRGQSTITDDPGVVPTLSLLVRLREKRSQHFCSRNIRVLPHISTPRLCAASIWFGKGAFGLCTETFRLYSASFWFGADRFRLCTDSFRVGAGPVCIGAAIVQTGAEPFWL